MIATSMLFCLPYGLATWMIIATHQTGHGLLWFGGALATFFLLMRYLTSWQSLKEKYVFPKGGGPGEYFPGNVYTRKKYLRGMEGVFIYTDPVTVRHSATFAQDGKVMRLSISISFVPDTRNLSLYCARLHLARHDTIQYVDSSAVSALLREVLADLVKEGTCYCEGCAEDRLRDGLRALGLVLKNVSRTLKSDTMLLD